MNYKLFFNDILINFYNLNIHNKNENFINIIILNLYNYLVNNLTVINSNKLIELMTLLFNY